MSEYPQKEFYKLNEVCRYTDTQPYVLRFWESEFPQLQHEKSGSGQPVYRQEVIDLVRRIKYLLYEEECSLEAARKELESDASAPGGRKKARRTKTTKPDSASSAARKLQEDSPQRVSGVAAAEAPSPGASDAGEVVSRQRYDDAVEEVHHLRLRLKEAEKAIRKAEGSAEDAAEEAQRQRHRAARASARIEELLDSLS